MSPSLFENDFSGWFIDETSSNDADRDAFQQALVAAKNLNDTFSWPSGKLSFQSVYANVTVNNI